MRRLAFVLLLSGCASLPPSPPASGALLRAMEASDVEAAGEAVADVLRVAGFDLPDDLGWKVQAFDEPINFYSAVDHDVTISHIPTPDQTSAYWRMWSDLLTGGTWHPDAFFRDSTEAHRLAAFNQAVLAAHELGHGLAYRYTVNPRTDDGNVNCQELVADRVAAAVLHELATEDVRIRRLRTRYLQLISAINTRVPEAHRYAMPSREVLLTDCRSIEVAQPAGPADLVPYASAFFERHRLLYGRQEPESLETLADEVFLPPLREYLDHAPEAEGPVLVRTLGPLATAEYMLNDDLWWLLENHREWNMDEMTHESRAYAISPDGTPLLLAMESLTRLDTDSTSATLSLGHAAGSLRPRRWTFEPGEVLRLGSAVGLARDRAVAVVRTLRVDSVGTGGVRLLLVGDSDGPRMGPQLDLSPDAHHPLFRLPDGRITLATPRGLHPVELTTLTLGPSEASSLDGLGPEADGLAISTTGPILAERSGLGVQYHDYGTMPVQPGGTVLLRAGRRIAGSSIPSTRDGTNPDAVAFQTILAADVLADGRILIVEEMEFEGNGRYPRGTVVLREVLPSDVIRARGE